MASFPEDLALAHELADAADRITLAHFRTEGLVVDTKPDMTPVSEADREVERVVRARLGEARPKDSVLGEEEGGLDGAAGGRRWVLDPIDGTKGYVRGMPVWATLISLEEDGRPVVGLISAPALRRRWWASRGAGAYVADGLTAEPRRLRVSAVSQLADAQLTFGDLEDWKKIGRLDAFLELAQRCWRTRGLGDFWSYMLVAEGAAEIATDPVVAHWDMSASQVIVEEAGGQQTDLAGAPVPHGGSGLASNGRLHQAALAILGA